MLPCLIYEDEHLLVVNKPAGLNTHAPSPYAGEGLYEWLRERESRWSNLAIMQRLDKETSGIIVFSKTLLANRSLTEQFRTRAISKKYVLLTDRAVSKSEMTVRSRIARAGEKYIGRPLSGDGEPAETRFKVCSGWDSESGCTMLEAEPVTGRTHQIRVHAAENGFPILGDTLYGGTPAARVHLHATEIAFEHPSSGKRLQLRARVEFETDPRLAYRLALVEPKGCTAYRVIHGASDGWPGWYVDRFGAFLLSESSASLTSGQLQQLSRLMLDYGALGAYHKIVARRKATAGTSDNSPKLLLGKAAPERFTITENGLEFEISFVHGSSIGLFLDQRDNRRRLLTGHIGTGFELMQRRQPAEAEPDTSGNTQRGLHVLNMFSYTCGLSVCAAKAGAHTVNVDLSNKYLEWGRRNFQLNQLEPAEHEFLTGESFDWLRRLRKRDRYFDVILLDPPTFSQSKRSGAFRAEKDFGRLVAASLTLLRSGGVLFASSNAATWPAEDFLETVEQQATAAGSKVTQKHYFPQPPDFPVARLEPAYLKTVWWRIEKENT